jgi:hypothetical protein
LFSLKHAATLSTILLISATVACGGGGSTTNPLARGGGSWEQVNTPPGATRITFVDFGSGGNWFIADRRQGFYRSADQGTTWTQINSGPATKFGWTINVDPFNGDLIASIYSAGGLNASPVTFYRSLDEGNSWTAIPFGHLSSATAWTGCAFAANGNIVCGGYWAPSPRNGAWVSTNAGQSAIGVSLASTNSGSVYALAIDPATNDLWMGTEQNGIFRSTDNGLTWKPASPPATSVNPAHGIRDTNIYAITFDRNGNVLFGSQGGIWKSSKNGAGYTWKNVLNNPNTSAGMGLGRDATGILYYGHKRDSKNSTVVFCSTDDGTTWSACDSGLPPSLVAHRFAVNPGDHRLYVVTQDEHANVGRLYRTTNPVQ